MTHARLDEAAIAAALAALPGWSGDVTRLRRTYHFGGFVEAMAFMSAAMMPIVALDHHPEWSNIYDRVHVELTTHDAGGVTTRDVELAGRLEQLASLWPRR